jgi:hypothetical protein
MKFILPASGKPNFQLFSNLSDPKCLITLKSGRTILDVQMDVFSNYPYPVTMILGYEYPKIMKHCEKMGYDIDFKFDSTWEQSHSLTRMIGSMADVFNHEHMLIFSDTLFTNELIDHLLPRNFDIVKCANVRKISKRGAEAMIDTIHKYPEIKDLNAQLFFKIQELHPEITVEHHAPSVWQHDIDNQKELVHARNMNF